MSDLLKQFNRDLKADFSALVNKYEQRAKEIKASGQEMPKYSLFIAARLHDKTSGKMYSSGLSILEQFNQLEKFKNQFKDL